MQHLRTITRKLAQFPVSVFGEKLIEKVASHCYFLRLLCHVVGYIFRESFLLLVLQSAKKLNFSVGKIAGILPPKFRITNIGKLRLATSIIYRQDATQIRQSE